MAHTTHSTATDKMSVVLFFFSFVYCIFLAVAPSMPPALLIIISIAGNIAWVAVFLKVTENPENQSEYSFLNIPSAIIWISLITQAL